MNTKAITKATIAAEREALMWNWQSPTVPACNPHPPQSFANAPRYKGPYQPGAEDIARRRKERAERRATIKAQFRSIYKGQLADDEDYSLLE